MRGSIVWKPSEFPSETLLSSVMQFGIFLRQLFLARQHHALRLAEYQPAPEMDGGPAVVVCFDAVGEPWCPSLPNMGIGDPYRLSDRLHDWWLAWQRQFASLGGKDWSIAGGGHRRRMYVSILSIITTRWTRAFVWA
jgi:hypothetical protein